MYLCFIDESGDHGLDNIDPNSPMFAITACVYKEDDYFEAEIPSLAKLKHKYWNHEGVIFHSYAIRKKIGHFSVLADPVIHTNFCGDVASHFRHSKCTIISAVIDKNAYKAKYNSPYDAYSLATGFVLERIYLMARNDAKIVFEARGKKEDKDILEWYRGFSTNNATGSRVAFKSIEFAKKKDNVSGLQMADLACHPIIEYVKNNKTQRPDWIAVRPRIRSSWRTIMGWGLKVFP